MTDYKSKLIMTLVTGEVKEFKYGSTVEFVTDYLASYFKTYPDKCILLGGYRFMCEDIKSYEVVSLGQDYA